MAGVVVVRHTRVARSWSGRCYGHSDPGLSRDGRRAANDLAAMLAQRRVDLVVHSGLTRARILAELIAGLSGADLQVDARWRERNFGRWECRTWNSIWRESGNDMDGMLTRPGKYRPGGGETTSELTRRVLSAWRDLPRDANIVVVTHGGPMATLRSRLERRPLREVMKARIPEGGYLRLKR